MKIIEDTITFTLVQNGFHGWRDIPIRGKNWRRWSDDMIAFEMDKAAENEMFKAAACNSGGCLCGGYFCAEPTDKVGTWMIPYNWIERGMDDQRLVELAEEMEKIIYKKHGIEE